MLEELILSFPDNDQVIVEYNRDRTQPLDFIPPITDEDRKEIRWYLEKYAAEYTIDLDDDRAGRIEAKFKPWGEALFKAVFPSARASQIFFNFYDACGEDGGLITIDTAIPEILSLPWELLCVEGRQLVHEDPHIAVRRCLSGAGGIGRRFRPEPRDRIHILFVVSRPRGAGFLDPRSDPLAVMDALDAEAPGRATVEFLRPPTLDNLTERLKRLSSHKDKPAVDILHFDGHGVFDKEGRLIDKARQTDPEAAVRDGGEALKPDTGYLLFEDEKGGEALITAETLGNMLTNQKVALTVLSACQSAAVGEADPMSGVAARLTHAGIPAVVAMTHSVLVATTRRLFGKFYARMAGGMGAGSALDEARQDLYRNPERGERRRGETGRFTLRLQDWFLPALYQSGDDPPLLTPDPDSGSTPSPDEKDPVATLPAAGGAGFFGRSAELWTVERAYAAGVRRITVSGFGGQGKTVLAAEAGRWLVRTGLFDRAAFVGFADYQGVDPVRMAVTTLMTVLNQNLKDAAEAETALKETPTLVILDNLESLADEGRNTLLDAAAGWSRAGNSRVLITTRQSDLSHPAWSAELDPEHIRLVLAGLAEHDALAWFAALWSLPPDPDREPPEPHGLVALFKRVDFHPLSVSLLAYQLKLGAAADRAAADLGERLEALLTDAPGDGPDRNLMASLNLSLERLDPEARKWLPRLGIFHGGAMENVLLDVTGLGESAESQVVKQIRLLVEGYRENDPEAIEQLQTIGKQHGLNLEQTVAQLEKELAGYQQTGLAEGADESTWPALRGALEIAGLIQAERLPGVSDPYLKFHPTLAPALKDGLDPSERDALAARHRAAYYRLSGELYHLDDKNPHAARAVVQRELPNLLVAVRAALDAGDADGASFVDYVNKFLNNFGLTRDRDDLTARAEQAAAPGSRAWYLAMSNKGEALWGAGRHGEAEAVFREILKAQGDEPSYERCLTLGRLGRCLHAAGRTAEAVKAYRDELDEAKKLDQTDGLRREIGTVQTDLGDALTDSGQYAEARAAYEAGLEIIQEIGDDRSVAVIQGQLGTLAMMEGDLNDAIRRYREALDAFGRMNEPGTEAVFWHQLGNAFQQAKRWDEAESAYRESARLKESRGNISGAADSYQNLALVMENAGKPGEAETWYIRAMEAFRQTGERGKQSVVANNLADLLQNDPARLDEARKLAEEALAIKETLDPGAAEIWKTYTILAKIADKGEDADGAREYRRLAREAKAAFAGTPHELKKHASLIIGVVNAVNDPDQLAELEPQLKSRMESGWTQLVGAVRKILDGQRDEAELVDELDFEDSMIISTILSGIENPDSLEFLASSSAPAGQSQQSGTSITPQQAQIAMAGALPIHQPETKPQVEPLLTQLESSGFTDLAAAIRRIWDGERDEAALTDGLDDEDTTTVRVILAAAADPSILQQLAGMAGMTGMGGG